MRKLRRTAAVAAAGALSLAVAPAALANTNLFVSKAGANSGNCQSAPCLTINYAVTQAASVNDPVTINVGPGTYTEHLVLTAQNSGLTIVGAGSGADPAANTILAGDNTANTIAADPVSALTLSNLRIYNAPAVSAYNAIEAANADVAMSNVAVDVENLGSAVYAPAGSATVTGGSVTVGSAAGSGYGVYSSSIVLSGAPVVDNGAGPAISSIGSASVTNSQITLGTANSAYGVFAANGMAVVTGTTVDQHGTGYGVYGGNASVTMTGGSVTLDNPTNSNYAVFAGNGSVSLTNVPVRNSGTGYGVFAGTGTVTMDGGSVTLDNPTNSNYGVFSGSGGVSLTGVPVVQAGFGYGVYVGTGPLAMTGGSVTLSNPANASYAVYDGSGSLTLTNVPVTQPGVGYGVYQGSGRLTISGGSVGLSNPANGAYAVYDGSGGMNLADLTITYAGTGIPVFEGSGAVAIARVNGSSTLPADTNPLLLLSAGRVTIASSTLTNAGTGPALQAAGSTTVSDSTITGGASATSPLVVLTDGGPFGRTNLILRSTLREQAPTQAVVNASVVNLTIDSSLLLGGTGPALSANGGAARLMSIVASTIDAGTLGVRDGGGHSLLAGSDNTAGSLARVSVQGSILVEPPASLRAGASGAANVSCSYTEVPSTTQAQAGLNGAINCAAGSAGNTATAALTAIFANPGIDYAPNPSWSGVDSIPPGGISIPSGAPSATDLRGNPRVLNGVGTCSAGLQDMGAIELAGHGGIVPAPSIVVPAVGAGAPATFTAGAPNDPGAPLTGAWQFSDGTSAAGTSVAHSFTHAGPATATVTLTAPGSCTGTTTASFTVVAKDAISGFKLTPSSFRLPSSGKSPAVAAKSRGGTVVSYTGTAAATTTFSIQAPTPGRTSGHSCVKQTAKNRHARACTRYVAVRSFARDDSPGTIRFRFTGRFASGKLSPGRYRLQAVPHNAAGDGAPATASFTVLR